MSLLLEPEFLAGTRERSDTALSPLASMTPAAGRNRFRSGLTLLLPYAVLLPVLVSVVYPLVWLASASLKTDRATFSSPFAPPVMSDLQWGNYTRAWSAGHFRAYFLNSVALTIAVVAVTTLLSAMTAYALTRFTFRGTTVVQFALLAGLILPLQQVIVPLFFQMRFLHLLDSLSGLGLVYIALGLPFGVFVMGGFFRSLPASVYESAIVDGAGDWRAFWSVMLPMARAGLATVAIFTFLGTWNEYFVAYMLLGGRDDSPRTLPLGLANLSLAGQYRSDWGMAFAGLVVMLLPTLFVCVLLQRFIAKGLTAGAVKG